MSHPEALLSVRGASDWLKAHGIRASSRHMVLVAIAKGTLPVAATTARSFLVRVSDLECYALTAKGTAKEPNMNVSNSRGGT